MRKEDILEALEEARESFKSREHRSNSLCLYISKALEKKLNETSDAEEFPYLIYRCDCVRAFIPEFHPLFFGIPESISINEKNYRVVFWWDKSDRESRLEALNKLIEHYTGMHTAN